MTEPLSYDEHTTVTFVTARGTLRTVGRPLRRPRVGPRQAPGFIGVDARGGAVYGYDDQITHLGGRLVGRPTSELRR